MKSETITVQRSWFESSFDVTFGATQRQTLQMLGDEILALHAASKCDEEIRDKMPGLLLALASRLHAGAEWAARMEDELGLGFAQRKAVDHG